MRTLKMLFVIFFHLILVSDIFSQTSQFNLAGYKQFLEQNQNMKTSQILDMYPAGTFKEKANISWETVLYHDSLEIKYNLTDSTFQAQKQNEIRFDVKSLDESGLKQLIDQRNRKFLFLNVWATWCAPCREEFPDLVKLAEEYNSSNVEFVGLSVDYPDEIESKIIPFLKNNKVNFTIYVQNFKDEENIINSLNKEWSGAIPATFIFDPNGAQQAFLFGKHDYNGFRKELEKILND